MSPREKLLRLALAMPEAGVPTICRAIAWVCPGIDDPAKPAMVRDAAELTVHEFADSELTVGGPLPDSIELALRNILVLLDRLDPTSGGQVRS